MRFHWVFPRLSADCVGGTILVLADSLSQKGDTRQDPTSSQLRQRPSHGLVRWVETKLMRELVCGQQLTDWQVTRFVLSTKNCWHLSVRVSFSSSLIAWTPTNQRDTSCYIKHRHWHRSRRHQYQHQLSAQNTCPKETGLWNEVSCLEILTVTID